MPPVSEERLILVRDCALRLERGSEAAICGELPQGTEVVVVKSDATWAWVQSDNGIEGWLEQEAARSQPTEADQRSGESPIGSSGRRSGCVGVCPQCGYVSDGMDGCPPGANLRKDPHAPRGRSGASVADRISTSRVALRGDLFRAGSLLLSVGVLLGFVLGCSAFALYTNASRNPNSSPASTAVAAEATLVQALRPTPTLVVEISQSRTGQPLPVWGSTRTAWLAQLDPAYGEGGLQCTIAPYTDVKVIKRGLAYTPSAVDKSILQRENFFTGASEVDTVAQVSTVDGRCTGFVLEAFLTAK